MTDTNLSRGTKSSGCGVLLFQEQMKQQQWQQQQQQGVLPQTVPSQPSGSAVPPPPHRPLYQPMQPHPQHLASMGFDPRWLMMQSYMDPRMMSSRPAMDIPPIHPGELELMLCHGSLQLCNHLPPIFTLNSFKVYHLVRTYVGCLDNFF